MYMCEISLKNVSSFSNMNTSLSFLYSVDYETLIPFFPSSVVKLCLVKAFDLSVTDHPIQHLPLVVLDEFKRKRKLINVNTSTVLHLYAASFSFFLLFYL